MTKKLTELQAFNVMRKFLEMYYERTLSDDVGSLLGDLQIGEDGETTDPAAWHDWMDALHKAALEEGNNTPSGTV